MEEQEEFSFDEEHDIANIQLDPAELAEFGLDAEEEADLSVKTSRSVYLILVIEGTRCTSWPWS